MATSLCHAFIWNSLNMKNYLKANHRNRLVSKANSFVSVYCCACCTNFPSMSDEPYFWTCQIHTPSFSQSCLRAVFTKSSWKQKQKKGSSATFPLQRTCCINPILLMSMPWNHTARSTYTEHTTEVTSHPNWPFFNQGNSNSTIKLQDQQT